ncbi:MAG TPA: hypothetical protein VF443_06510 [Nitrospira sp.]
MGGGGTNTVTKSDPWSGVQPYLASLYQRGHEYSFTPGPQFYPNSTIAPQSSDTLQAQNMIRSRAMLGSPQLPTAQKQNLATMNGAYFQNASTPGLLGLANGSAPQLQALNDAAGGKFLNANPYVDSMFNQASEGVGRQFRSNVLPGVASMFEGAGRYGSNAMGEQVGQAADSYGRTLDNLATQIYGGNYANERGFMQNASTALGTLGLGANTELGSQFARERFNQTSATKEAPTLAAADYNDPTVLGTLGQSQDARAQSLLQSDIDRWNYNQNQPQNMLSYYSQLLNGTAGFGGGTKSTSASGDPLMQALGYGMMGSSLYSNLGGAGLFGAGAAGDAAASAALLDGLAGVGTGVAGMSFADALAAGLIAL